MGCEEITWAWRTFRGILFAQTPSSPDPREDSVREEKEDYSVSIRYQWGTVWFIRSKEPGLMSKAEELPLHSRLEPQDPVELVVRSSHVALRDLCLPPGLHPSFLLSSGRVPQGHLWWNPSPAVRWETVLRWTAGCCFLHLFYQLGNRTQVQYTDLCNQWQDSRQLRPQLMRMVCESPFRAEATDSKGPEVQ